jgi:hypothetical protein
MNNLNYHAGITAKTTVAEAFDKINQVSSWWSQNFEGSAQKPGDAFTVRFGEVWKNFAVVESVAGKRIEWEVTDCHLPWLADRKEWTNTFLVWEFSAGKDCTQIDFTHVGLIPEMECYDDCKPGWDFYLNESLAKLLNEGRGLPHKN